MRVSVGYRSHRSGTDVQSESGASLGWFLGLVGIG